QARRPTPPAPMSPAPTPRLLPPPRRPPRRAPSISRQTPERRDCGPARSSPSLKQRRPIGRDAIIGVDRLAPFDFVLDLLVGHVMTRLDLLVGERRHKAPLG